MIQLATAYRWDAGAWLRRLDSTVVAPLLAEAGAQGLVPHLGRVVEDPDVIVSNPSPGLLRLARLLVERNLLVYKAAPSLAGDTVPADPELGVGEYYAWQLPAYPILLRERLRGVSPVS